MFLRQLYKVLYINVLALERGKVAAFMILEISVCVLENEARGNKVQVI